MKILINKIAPMLVVSALAMPGSAMATGIPTVDVANIIQTTATALENIEQTATLGQQLQNAIQQYQQLQQQYQSMTGSRNMGGLITGAQKALDRRWAPADINQAMNTIKAGGIPGTNQSYRVAVERFTNNAGSVNSADLRMGNNGYLANSSNTYDASRVSNLSALGLSETAYSNTNKRTEDIELLMANIDTAPDQKAALDLLNTLIAQMLVLQNESVRLQSAILQNQASTNLHNANAETAEAQFHNRGNLP